MKNKNFIPVLLFIMIQFISCEETKESNKPLSPHEKNNMEVVNQTKYNKPDSLLRDSTSQLNDSTSEITSILGDLDKDGIDEKVIVSNASESTESGIERKISIYKYKNKNWELWHQNQGVVQPWNKEETSNDPFEEITIENGCIVIKHSGGMRSEWHLTHTYRYQKGDWYLIGASNSFGQFPTYWCSYDYNLSIGKIEVSKTFFDNDHDDKDEDSTVKFTLKIKPDFIPHMDGFEPGKNSIQIPNTDDNFDY